MSLSRESGVGVLLFRRDPGTSFLTRTGNLRRSHSLRHRSRSTEVIEEIPGERVSWRCLAGPPEWIGTELSFDVQTDAEGGASVLFSHEGWRTTQQSFPFIAYSWAQILPRPQGAGRNGPTGPLFQLLRAGVPASAAGVARTRVSTSTSSPRARSRHAPELSFPDG